MPEWMTPELCPLWWRPGPDYGARRFGLDEGTGGGQPDDPRSDDDDIDPLHGSHSRMSPGPVRCMDRVAVTNGADGRLWVREVFAGESAG